MLRNISISARVIGIISILFFSILAMAGMMYFTANDAKNEGLADAETVMLQGEKEKIKLGVQTIALALSRALEGVSERKTQHDIIKHVINDYRFEEDYSGYYYTYIGTNIFMHPTLPLLEGVDLGRAADVNGVYYVRDLHEVATQGGGFVTFLFPKPGPNGNMRDVLKLAYVEYIPGTDIWISTGVYLDDIDVYKEEMEARMSGSLQEQMAIVIGAIATLLFFILIPLSVLTLRSIIMPLQAAARTASQFASGNFDAVITVLGNDELSELGRTFNQMCTDIKTYIRNLKVVTMEKERINTELSLASKIQTDMLPRIFPKFSGKAMIRFFATMESAKEVGGDFYDFFYLDEHKTKIVFVIADVSGKGIPAALFMVIAKTLIKEQMFHHSNPASAIDQVNKILCEDNPQCMFVTAIVFALDLNTGDAVYANGGHNPPLLSRQNNFFEFMELKQALPLGVDDSCKYQLCFLHLNPGDKLYLYTDGINEAMNAAQEEFGNKRFLEAANKYRGHTPEEFDEAIRDEIAVFCDGAEQSDDITSLAIEYLGATAQPVP
ncbi:MAG: SpoIIE family protein phosphatase [Spirochaetaceae bacterium]|jgi:serine phosphatase RsbU (regulator of sigma subunit)/HAMP domain-containing protein|nr:SpoIIE family protein phosphatase [Spirochaetaceae bacterium]